MVTANPVTYPLNQNLERMSVSVHDTIGTRHPLVECLPTVIIVVDVYPVPDTKGLVFCNALVWIYHSGVVKVRVGDKMAEVLFVGCPILEPSIVSKALYK